MKITGVTATSIRIPVDHAPYSTENGGTKNEWHGRLTRVTPKRPSPCIDYVLIRIETDEGISGVGEAQADMGFFGTSVEEVAASVEDYLGPQLIGKDPFDREYLSWLVDYRGNSCAKAGIDVALHDLIGKALGVPVAALLGGLHQSKILVAVEIAGGPPDEMARVCLEFMAQGVRAFKPKVGADPELDADRLRAIREAVGPAASLRADANQGYTAKEAIRFCRLVERYDVGLELLEQPVAAWDLQAMAAVRRSVDVPIEADESCFTIYDAMQIVRHEAADVLNIKLGKVGGLYNAKKIAAIAEAAGLKCVIGTAWGTGLEIAAKLHLAASTMTVTDAVEFTELGLHRNLLAEPHDTLLALPLSDGCLPVPTGPGLGVTLDEDEVKLYDLASASRRS